MQKMQLSMGEMGNDKTHTEMCVDIHYGSNKLKFAWPLAKLNLATGGSVKKL